MGQHWDNKILHHCNTRFEDQWRLFTVNNSELWIIEKDKKIQATPSPSQGETTFQQNSLVQYFGCNMVQESTWQ
eukprot:9173183-Ditylum_brightwellii.AAC.1